MKNIIIVAHFLNLIFAHLSITRVRRTETRQYRGQKLELKLKVSLACFDFLWTANPVQAKMMLKRVSDWFLICLNLSANQKASFNIILKTFLSKNIKTKLGNKNGYFFEICKRSNFNSHMTLTWEVIVWPQMTSYNFRAFLNFLFIVNFSLVSIWKKLKTSITSPSVFSSALDTSSE